MENVKLPTQKAHEPAEEAHQPVMCNTGRTMSSQETDKPKKRHATFAESAMTTEKELSQNSSAYKEALSQPAPEISHHQRLAWLQRRRGTGLWVQCDACNAWRHLAHVVDSHQLPPKWYCSMNPDKSMADCSAPETPLRMTDEEDLIHSEYSAGSLVWARLPGWPWWPAMVDDEPDTEQFYWLDGFSDIPTHYNVVFFDATGATRAWISPENLKPYTPNKKKFRYVLNAKRYKKRLEQSIKEADQAEKLPVVDRLANFSFISTYKGPIVSPKKVSKRELEMYQNKLKRKFNVDFPIEATSESEDGESTQTLREINKKKNVILVGTPGSKRTKQSAVSHKDNVIVEKPVQEKQDRNKNPPNKAENNLNGENKEENLTKKHGNKEAERNNKIFKSPIKSSIMIKKMLSFSSHETADTHEKSCKLPNSMITEIGITQSLNMVSQMNGIDNKAENNLNGENKEENLTKKHGNKEAERNNKIFKSPIKSSIMIKKMLSFSSHETADTHEKSCKLPNSMITEIGITQSLNMGSQMNGIDNDRRYLTPEPKAKAINMRSEEFFITARDSSKTYVPEEDASDPVFITQDFNIRAETPSSDDFDF